MFYIFDEASGILPDLRIRKGSLRRRTMVDFGNPTDSGILENCVGRFKHRIA